MTWLRYVALDEVGKFLAIGWKLVDDLADCHHGQRAVLMEWEGEEEPK